MTILFENRITEDGKAEIGKLRDHIARELDKVTQSHGRNSKEATQHLLAFNTVDQIMEPREEAHAGIQRYIALSKESTARIPLKLLTDFCSWDGAMPAWDETRRWDWPWTKRSVSLKANVISRP